MGSATGDDPAWARARRSAGIVERKLADTPPTFRLSLAEAAPLVCSGRLGLAAAQRAIAANWIGAYRRYVGQ